MCIYVYVCVKIFINLHIREGKSDMWHVAIIRSLGYKPSDGRWHKTDSTAEM